MTETDVQQLLLTVVKPLVTDPDSVVVTIEEDKHFLNFNLSVAKPDIGRVIGKNGRVAQAIRTIIYSMRLDVPLKIRLNIVDN